MRWQTCTHSLSLPLILSWATLCLAFVLPGHYLPWLSFQQEAVAGVAGLLMCWAAVEKTPVVLWPRAARVVLTLALVPWLQFLFGQIRFLSDAVLSSGYLAAAALALCAGATLAAGARRAQLLDGLTAAFVAAGIASTGLALYQWLRLPALGLWASEVPPGARVFANLAQPNHLSSLLALGVAGLLRWFETRRMGSFAAAFGVAWLGLGIAMTQSRTGWVFACIAAAGCLIMKRRCRLRVANGAVIVGLLSFAVLVVGQDALQQLWAPGRQFAEHAIRIEGGTRATHWRVLFDAALRSPWVGYGWNQTVRAQWATADHYPATGEAVMQSHNLLLDLLIYNGVILGAVLGAALVWIIRRAWRLCRNGENWTVLLALLALAAHALLEYPLHYLYFLLPAAMLLGALGVTMPGFAVSPLRASPRWTLSVGTALMAALLLWIGTEYIHTEEALRRLRFANARLGITRAQLTSPDVKLLDGWKAYHDATLVRLRAGMSGAERQLVIDAAERYPYPVALQREALMLALNGDPDGARRVLRHMCKVHSVDVEEVMRQDWNEWRDREAGTALGVEFPKCSR